ncbi:hypothetical protein D3C73_861920 [compost metagenome]
MFYRYPVHFKNLDFKSEENLVGINSKGRRKIEFNGRRYYWSIQEDTYDYGKINLSIVSEDKKLNVSYHIAQSDHDKPPYIVIKGLEFAGLEYHYRQGWTRVQTPIWDDRIISPGYISSFIVAASFYRLY